MRLQRKGLTLGLSLALAASFSSKRADAGNADAFYLSGEAALIGGAVAATSSGGGSIWYNPAGLSHLRGTRVDVNVSGYAVRFGATADFDSSVPNTTETRLALLDLDVVPAALTLTRRFGNIGVGLGVFVPSQNAVVLRTHLVAPPDENGNSLEFGYDSTSRYQEYHMGPGVGWDAHEDLSLGLSLLANYRTRVEVTDVTATVDSDGSKSSLFQHNTLDSQGVGLEMVLGGQYRFLNAWSLGLVVRTPAIRLGEAVHSVDAQLQADTSGTVDETVVFSKQFGVSAQVLTPFRFHSGLAYTFGNWTASGEGSVLLPFNNELFDHEERLTVNARAGLRKKLNDFWGVGGGVFTDRSQFKAPTQFQQSQLDYYGATIAVDWLRTYGIVSKGRKSFDELHALNFGTTVALSYGIGLGTIVGARVGTGPGGQIEFEESISDVVAHEITLHIGSTFSEQ